MAEYVDVSEIEEVSPNIFSAGFVDGWNTLARIIKDGAKADVAPVVHGHYVVNDDGDASCSACQEPYLSITQNYCPNCGAKMDLED